MDSDFITPLNNMKEFDEMTAAWTEFCAKIEPLLPKPAAEPEPDPRLTWELHKHRDALRISPGLMAGSVHVTADFFLNASELWESALAYASAAMALEGMDEPEEPVEKLPGVGPLEHYRTWAWLNLEAICRKQEGGE